ncbi:hypothetical protein AX17_004425 [Amanita inopinata Kibby_2008]|nr:hypothetical protein AX17_004425 [Amanita inopinata Kibby_2008]
MGKTPTIDPKHPSNRLLVTQAEDRTTDYGHRGVFRGECATRLGSHGPIHQPRILCNVDGTPNEAGMVREVVDLILHYQDHTERAIFAIANLGSQDVILGYTWLKNHNPEVDWEMGNMKMSHCKSQCHTCLTATHRETLQEWKARHKIHSCRTGPFPSLDIDARDEAAEDWIQKDLAKTFEDIDIDPEDRLFTWTPPREPLHIRATGNISQRLAEAAAKTTKDFRDPLPNYISEFVDVFAKEAFDQLPEPCIWDHAIKLTLGATPQSCKVYPLSITEQEQLDAFLKENLETGHIRPSKSPMASPFFFIKKKDGTLCPVQDYRMLNALTIKNKYPLPLISDLVNQLRGAKYFTKLDV